MCRYEDRTAYNYLNVHRLISIERALSYLWDSRYDNLCWFEVNQQSWQPGLVTAGSSFSVKSLKMTPLSTKKQPMVTSLTCPKRSYLPLDRIKFSMLCIYEHEVTQKSFQHLSGRNTPCLLPTKYILRKKTWYQYLPKGCGNEFSMERL